MKIHITVPDDESKSFTLVADTPEGFNESFFSLFRVVPQDRRVIKAFIDNTLSNKTYLKFFHQGILDMVSKDNLDTVKKLPLVLWKLSALDLLPDEIFKDPRLEESFVNLIDTVCTTGYSKNLFNIIKRLDVEHFKLPNGNNLLHICVETIFLELDSSDEVILNYLLENNVSYTDKNKDGKTPLQLALKRGKFSACKALLARDYDAHLLNEQDEQGNTALHRAALYSNDRLFYLLLREGSDHSIKNSHGKTPWNILYKPSIERKNYPLAALAFFKIHGAILFPLFDSKKQVGQTCGFYALARSRSFLNLQYTPSAFNNLPALPPIKKENPNASTSLRSLRSKYIDGDKGIGELLSTKPLYGLASEIGCDIEVSTVNSFTDFWGRVKKSISGQFPLIIPYDTVEGTGRPNSNGTGCYPHWACIFAVAIDPATHKKKVAIMEDGTISEINAKKLYAACHNLTLFPKQSFVKRKGEAWERINRTEVPSEYGRIYTIEDTDLSPLSGKLITIKPSCF